MCHGFGIADTNELNFYIEYWSHQREYRIGEGKKKKGIYMLDNKASARYTDTSFAEIKGNRKKL